MEDRVKAAYYAWYARICAVLSYVAMGAAILGALFLRQTRVLENEAKAEGLALLLLLPAVALLMLGRYFKKRRLRLLCTSPATARYLYSVTRGGRSRRRYPVVEYEVEGVTYTAELDVRYSRGIEGEEYDIFYDPQDPATVRAACKGE